MTKTYKWNFSSAKRPDSGTMLWLYKNYVLDCPVEGVSASARSIGELGWRKRDVATLMSQMKKESSLASNTWLWEEDKDRAFLNALERMKVKDGYDVSSEFAIYARAGKGKAEGLFYLIRNSLAHGSFRYHNTKSGAYLALETSNRGKLRGRAVLKIETLRNWRSILNDSSKFLARNNGKS